LGKLFLGVHVMQAMLAAGKTLGGEIIEVWPQDEHQAMYASILLKLVVVVVVVVIVSYN
jgi:hypothetical protein